MGRLRRRPWGHLPRPARIGAPLIGHGDTERFAVIVLASSPAHQFFTIFGAVLAGIGLIFLLVGWIIRRTSRQLGGPTAQAQGTIVGFDTSVPGAMRVRGTRVRVSTWSSTSRAPVRSTDPPCSSRPRTEPR